MQPLFIDIRVVIDLPRINPLLALNLVCVGVMNFPPREKKRGDKSFHMPRINGQWIVPVLFLIFVYGYRERVKLSFLNGGSSEEIMFILLLLAAFAIGVLTFLRKLSLIPVLGMHFCLYLLIEISPKS